MHEHRLTVARTARYVTLGPPGAARREIWFALHGYGQLAPRFAHALTPLDDGTRLVVIPEGLSRFYLGGAGGKVGASWMTREGRVDEITDYVRYLDTLLDTVVASGTEPAIHVLGFSQGSATACRWITDGAVRPERLVIWGGEIPPDLDWSRARERFRRLLVLLVAGEDDEFATAAALAHYEMILEREGVRHDLVRFRGGHALDAATLAAIATPESRSTSH